MKQVEVNYLDDLITVTENEENKFEELKAILGSEEDVCEEVTSNLRYRNRHPRIYKKACAEIVSLFPKPIKKKVGDKVIYVSDIDHLREAWKAGHSEKITDVITKLGQSEPLYVKGERSGTGRISQAALDAANGMIAEGEERVEGVIKFIEETVPGYKVSRDPSDESVSVENLARAVQRLNKHLEAESKKKTQAILGTVGKGI